MPLNWAKRIAFLVLLSFFSNQGALHKEFYAFHLEKNNFRSTTSVIYILLLNQINHFLSTLNYVPFKFTLSFNNLFSKFSYSTSWMLDAFILINRSPSGWLIVISYTSWACRLCASTHLFSLPLIFLLQNWIHLRSTSILLVWNLPLAK